MNVQEIKVEKFPLVIITDSHTNLTNVRKARELHPDCQIICLGDITFLFAKEGDKYNHYSIDYFKENKIPCLKGNHEAYILQMSLGDSFAKTLNRLEGRASSEDPYDLTQQQMDYLRSLPIGFKLILPDKSEYLCYHNKPEDLWGFTHPKDIDEAHFVQIYKARSSRTKGIIIGHQHYHAKKHYDKSNCDLIVVGRLSKDGEYALLTERGIEFQKLCT